MAWGIRDKDTNHLHTIESNYQSSSSLDDPNWALIRERHGLGPNAKGGAVGVELEVEVHCDGGLISW